MNEAIQVTCPRCGELGSLLYKCSGLSIVHFKKHGFEKRTDHYISKRKYPKFYRQIRNSLLPNTRREVKRSIKTHE